jgi:integrase
MVQGAPMTDHLGLMDDARAEVVAAQLRANRKAGAGPQSYKEMEDEAREKARVEAIEESKARKQIIAEDDFARSNTVASFWANVYWPKRSKYGSEHGNISMLGVWNNWISPVVGDVNIVDLTYIDIEKMLNNMREVKFTKHVRHEKKDIPDKDHGINRKAEIVETRLGRERSKGLSAKTQMHAYSILKGLWKEAQKYYKATRNIELADFPGKEVHKERINNEKTCWLRPDEVRLFLRTLKNWRACCERHGIHKRSGDIEDAYGMAVMSLFSGLRLGDICKLTWGEVDDRTIAYARDPKGGKAYGVHIDVPQIGMMLDERRARLTKPPRPKDLIFKNEKGRAWTSAPQVIEDVIDELGFNYMNKRQNNPMEKIDFHSLRHTFATMLVRNGESLYTVMKLMGHKSLKMTQRYAQLDPEDTGRAVKNICKDYEDLEC